MPWWVFVGVGFLVAATIVSIVMIAYNYISKKNLLLSMDILESEKKRAEKNLQTEMITRLEIEKEVVRLNEKHKQINDWYLKRKDEIEEKIRDEYENMAEDPALLSAKLDSLLGIPRETKRTRKEDTARLGKRNKSSTSEKR